MFFGMQVIVRREHRLLCYKKKDVLKLCFTIAKHRVILLLVRFEAKQSRSAAGQKTRVGGRMASEFETCNDLPL